jgi:5'-3' exonuclease
MKTWLLIDCPYICHWRFHAVKGLTADRIKSIVIGGFLQSIRNFQELFATSHIAFCFDLGTPKRQCNYLDYKKSRRLRHVELNRCIIKLRTKYLPMLGYVNMFAQEGYEADDIIAKLCLQLAPGDDKAIIVSSDHDLYQCLGPIASIYNPHTAKITTAESFATKWGIAPSQWAQVKAIAGCVSDDVPGVPGVREKTACKYLRGMLKMDGKAYQSILSNLNRINDNLLLVTLPYPGLPQFALSDDDVTDDKCDEVNELLGIKTSYTIQPRSKSTMRDGFLQ